MTASNDTLVLTTSAWGTRASTLATDFKRVNAEYKLDLVESPLFQLEMANDAILRRVLRELADWDAVKDKTPLTVAFETQDAPDALEFFDPLCLALKLREDRVKFAALDLETASAISEVCYIKDISKFHYKTVARPKLAGDMDELVSRLVKQEVDKELFLVLEASGAAGTLAKKLIANGLRVIRMGYYLARPKPLVSLKGIDPKKLWMLAMDIDMVKPAVTGLIRQNIHPATVKWVGNRPSVGALIKHEVPGATWVNVPELKPSTVMQYIAQY